jgi:hypothetical protein
LDAAQDKRPGLYFKAAFSPPQAVRNRNRK